MTTVEENKPTVEEARQKFASAASTALAVAERALRQPEGGGRIWDSEKGKHVSRPIEAFQPTLARVQDPVAKSINHRMHALVNRDTIKYDGEVLARHIMGLYEQWAAELRAAVPEASSEVAGQRMAATADALDEAHSYLAGFQQEVQEARQRREAEEARRFKRNERRALKINKAAYVRIDILDIADNLGVEQLGSKPENLTDFLGRCVQAARAQIGFPEAVVGYLADAHDAMKAGNLKQAWRNTSNAIDNWPAPEERLT